MSLERTVQKHYERSNIVADILAALGKSEGITPDDLLPFDEMHIGGRRATEYLAERMRLAPGLKVLDAGCGLGGAARHMAAHYNVHVTGVDLVPSFVEAATELSCLTNLSGQTEFREGSVLALPFADETFDAAYTIHTGMNIENKAGFYREVSRVLKKDALFAIYDILAASDVKSLTYPMPWAAEASASFLVTMDCMKELLNEEGFTIAYEEERRDFALESLKRALAAAKNGSDYRIRISNLLSGVEKEACYPALIFCRKT